MTIPSFISISTPATGTADDTVDLNYPSDIRAGDILIALVAIDAGLAATIVDYDGAGNAFISLIATATGVRRGVAVYYKMADGSETGAVGHLVSTSLGLGTVGGCIAIIRNGHPVVTFFQATGATGITNSAAPAPASITTTVDEMLAVAAIAYNNTGTIGPISTNSWAEFTEETNDGAWSYNFQMVELATAQTISGGTATLGTSGNWGVLTFAVRPLVPSFIPQSVIVN